MTDPIQPETDAPEQEAELAESALVEEVSIDRTGEPASDALIEEVSIDGMCGVY
jgi:mycofactocin precursor